MTKVIYEDEYRGVHLVLSGDISGKDLIETNYLISKDTTLHYQLWDFRLVNSLSVAYADIHQLAIQDRLIGTDANLKKIAIIGDESITSQLCDDYKDFCKWVRGISNFQTEHFKHLHSARDWIVSPA